MWQAPQCQTARVLDNLCVTVLQTEGCREKFGQSGVHTRQYRQLLVGVLGRFLLKDD